jgi:hypothetical protein
MFLIIVGSASGDSGRTGATVFLAFSFVTDGIFRARKMYVKGETTAVGVTNMDIISRLLGVAMSFWISVFVEVL